MRPLLYAICITAALGLVTCKKEGTVRHYHQQYYVEYTKGFGVMAYAVLSRGANVDDKVALYYKDSIMVNGKESFAGIDKVYKWDLRDTYPDINFSIHKYNKEVISNSVRFADIDINFDTLPKDVHKGQDFKFTWKGRDVGIDEEVQVSLDNVHGIVTGHHAVIPAKNMARLYPGNSVFLGICRIRKTGLSQPDGNAGGMMTTVVSVSKLIMVHD